MSETSKKCHNSVGYLFKVKCLLIDRKPVVTAAKENVGMKLLVKVKRVNQEFPT